MKRRRGAVAPGLLLTLCVSCTLGVGPGSTSSPGPTGKSDKRTYRVVVRQIRRGSGIARAPERASTVRAKIEELREGHRLTLRIVDASATGEPGPVSQARALRRRAVVFTVGSSGLTSVRIGLVGAADLNALDVALLFQMIAPLARDAVGTVKVPAARAAWAGSAIRFAVVRRAAGKQWARWIPADIVETRATGRLVFRLPVARASPSSGSARREPVVDEVFASLFAPVKRSNIGGGVGQGTTAIADPFLALGGALGPLFRDGRSGGGSRLATLPLKGTISLAETTSLYGSSALVVRARGHGTMHLKGALPKLGGDAAPLSKKRLTLDAEWIYSKDLVGPWPFGPMIPAVVLIIGDAVGIVIVKRRATSATARAR